MAITFRSAGTQATLDGNTGNLTLAAPAGVQATDVVLAVIIVSSNAAATNVITPPSGWTVVQQLDAAESGFGTNTAALYWALGNVASYAFALSGWAGPNGTSAGFTLAYTSVDNASPIDASNAQSNVAGTTVTAPSITTNFPNSMLVGIFADGDFGTFAALTFSAFFGTERGPSGQAAGHGAQFVPVGNFITVGIDASEAIQAAAGASGTKTVTLSVAPNPGHTIGILVALKDSAGGGPATIGLQDDAWWPW